MTTKSPDLKRMLRAAPWAAGLTPEQLLGVEAELTEKHYFAGDDIEHEGAPAVQWLGVIDGMVKVEVVGIDGRSTTFNCISGGGWFGEGSVIKGEPLRYDTVALLKSHLCFMPRATFLRLLTTSVPFNQFIIAQLNARLGQFVALTESSRLRDTVAQVAFCIVELFNPQLNPMPSFDIRISQEEFGRLCGCSRQVASRALHQLEQQGLVHVHHRGVEVLDVAGLARFGQLH